MALQNVITQQQKRVSALETELKAKDSEHGTLRTKLEQLQVHSVRYQHTCYHYDPTQYSRLLHCQYIL